MNMIQKTYPCAVPVLGMDVVREYDVSAWMAEGSNTVNLRLRDGFGWYGFMEVQVEKLSDYASKEIKTMDDLIEYLFWVVKA
jgi:hypothetical protein